MTEQSYTVNSDRVAGYAKGDTVTAADLRGNVDALVASGHLKKKTAKAAEKGSK